MATRMVMADLLVSQVRKPNSQRVAILNAPRQMSIAYADIPEPKADELRIKIKWVGICGSDIEAYRGTRKPEFISTPARLGHEVAGVIDKIGDDVVGLDAGAQVACRYVWGAFAEYIVCKPFNVKVLPKGFPLIECSLIEVLPGIIHAAELSEINASKTVLVIGQGVSGLVLTQILKLYSPRALVVTDTREKNLQLARHYGATHAYKIDDPEAPSMDVLRKDFPEGFDVVIPCLLEGDGMVDAIDCAAFCGKIVMYGCIGVCNKPIDFFTVHRKRLHMYTTEPRRDIDMRRFFQEGVQFVLDGLVNTKQMISEIVPLSEIDRAFKLRDDKGNEAIHVMVDCEK